MKECFRCGEETPYECSAGGISWAIYETSTPTCLLHLYEAALLAYRRGIRICREAGDDDTPHYVGVSRNLTDEEMKEFNEESIARCGEVVFQFEGIHEPELSAKVNIALTTVRGGRLAIF
ncbi:MAG: hypothetical protein Q7R43_06840 [Candidatus Daviesbacteria bacterium]|nr:hypothetical protein [Candidatus Daviesbacteria bacterium]